MITLVVLGVALLFVLGWASRRWLRQADLDEHIPLDWLIVSDQSGNQAIWECDGERVALDPFCPNDLLKMSPARRDADDGAGLLGWQCMRCTHSFCLPVTTTESPAELIARKFNARLRRLGKPASVGCGDRGRSPRHWKT